MAEMATFQYRVAVAKKDERVEGPDDADVVITVPLAVVSAEGFDPAIAYMQGKLKASGHTGHLFEALKTGTVAEALSRIASTI
jgi:hypothetical protein